MTDSRLRLNFRIEDVMCILATKRKIFYSEADFQFSFALVVKQMYPGAKIRLEYVPGFEPKMHVDVLIKSHETIIPIEMKYKTKECRKEESGEVYLLKNHGAKDINSYLYLQDIQRIERLRDNLPQFQEGYAIFLTNDLAYSRPPGRADAVYKEFSLEEGNNQKR